MNNFINNTVDLLLLQQVHDKCEDDMSRGCVKEVMYVDPAPVRCNHSFADSRKFA